MNRHLESIPYEGLKNGTHLDIEVYYSKGGYSFFGGSYERRGFYISVVPVTRGGGMVSTTLFSGVKQLILEVGRYSDKQFNKAVEMSASMKDALISHVLEKERAA